jgi:hypothetical protein
MATSLILQECVCHVPPTSSGPQIMMAHALPAIRIVTRVTIQDVLYAHLAFYHQAVSALIVHWGSSLMALSVRNALWIAKIVNLVILAQHVITKVCHLSITFVNVLQGNTRQAIYTVKTASQVATLVSSIAVSIPPHLAANQLNALNAHPISNSTLTVSA